MTGAPFALIGGKAVHRTVLTVQPKDISCVLACAPDSARHPSQQLYEQGEMVFVPAYLQGLSHM